VSKQRSMPDWVQRLFDDITATIKLSGKARMGWRFTPEEEANDRLNLLEMFPILAHAAQAGTEANGAIGYFDVRHVERAFNGGLTALFYGHGENGHPMFQLDGTQDEHEIMVLLDTFPIDETEESAQ